MIFTNSGVETDNIDGLDPATVYQGLEQTFESAVFTDPRLDGHRTIYLVNRVGHLASAQHIGGPSSGRSRHTLITPSHWARHYRDTARLTQFDGDNDADDYMTWITKIQPDDRVDMHEIHGGIPVVQPELAHLTASRVICARVLAAGTGLRLLEKQGNFSKARELGLKLYQGLELYPDEVLGEVTPNLLATFANRA